MIRCCVVGCLSRLSDERKRKALFIIFLQWSITKESRYCLGYCQHLLEGKTRQKLIGPRLDLVHDKNSMNSLKATSGIVTCIHHWGQDEQSSWCQYANTERLTNQPFNWVSHLMYVAREYKLTVMTSSARLDFYLMILRYITVLGFLFVKCWGWLSILSWDRFLGGKKCAFYCKSLITVLLKLRLYLGFLDIACRLGVSVATDAQKFPEIP